MLGIITRPRNWAEAWWAGGTACLLVLSSLVSVPDALMAVGRGTDVYLFLTGMMVLAELARREGLFDWLAHYALAHARGSGRRLFLLVYAVGTIVTVFLSNDATAVVLTPAVCAVVRQARAPALPYLLVCAFIANAASFVLPISNPANLVVFGTHMPSLLDWITAFGVASLVAILLTYGLLRWTQRKALSATIETSQHLPALTADARRVAIAIALTALALLTASALDYPLGLPTCVAGVAALLWTCAATKAAPWPFLREISWSILPLVAGLFVLVQAVQSTGLLTPLKDALSLHSQDAPRVTAMIGGSVTGIASNLLNNLPMGLIVATLAQGAHLSGTIAGALLIGVDLGPNLSVTGSLATILWLVAIRREGENVSAGRFLAVGALVMPPALLATLGAFAALSR